MKTEDQNNERGATPECEREHEHEDIFSLFRASPHQWGKGKIHIVSDDYPYGEQAPEKTICGVRLQFTTRQAFTGPISDVTCGGCHQALAAAARRDEAAARWEQDRQKRDASYNEYLSSPEWEQRRAAVLAREKGICQGCGIKAATQVHHLTYARIGNEMLFDLAAVCDDCHNRIHGRPQIAGYDDVQA